MFAEIGLQILLVFVGGAAVQVTPLPGREWAVSIVLGLFAMVVGAFMRFVPDRWFEWLWVKLHIMRNPNELPSASWNPALDKVHEKLTVFQQIRGNRLRGASKREALLVKNDIQP
jgi:Ca2+-transporting ATPase